MKAEQATSLISEETLIEGLNCAVILLDSQGLVQRVNLAAETLFRQSRRKLIGSNIAELVPDAQFIDCIDQSLLHSAQFTLREVELFGPDQDTLVDLTVSCLTSEQDQRQVLIEINAINRISRFMKEQHQQERQQSFRLMMRSLAHEIKNPLGGIRGAAQLLDRELQQASHQELTDILIKEADRLTRLVDRVMGSREALKPMYLNVHEILEHVVHLVQAKFDNQVLVQRFYDPALPEICVDREQIIQAVLNIVGNAIEAQEHADQVVLGLTTQFERFVTINQIMHRQVLKIQIWDDGPGVEEKMREFIFDPLVTGRANGTGLGLSISQEIVQRHQGIVQLEDYDGKTCFAIYLPYLNDHNELNKDRAVTHA